MGAAAVTAGADAIDICLVTAGTTTGSSSANTATIVEPFANQTDGTVAPPGGCGQGYSGEWNHGVTAKCPSLAVIALGEAIGLAGLYCMGPIAMPSTPLPAATICTMVTEPAAVTYTVHAGWDVNTDGVADGQFGAPAVEDIMWDAGSPGTGADWTVGWPSGATTGTAMVLMVYLIESSPGPGSDSAEVSCA